MKSLLWKVGLAVFVAALYISAPFASAWFIREAVRTGNSGYLSYAVEWPTVRETLKPAISKIALGLPDPAADPTETPTFWQRTKAYWGQGTVESLVDKYVTPEGLPRLFMLRNAYRSYITREPDEAQTTPLLERISRAWSRVKRAEFTGFTTFEIDMLDKHDPTRMYLGKMELTLLGWKLKELRIKFLPPAPDTAADLGGLTQQAM
jgi:hypothetical protein